MNRKELWKKREKAMAAGACLTVMGIAGMIGCRPTEAQAKTIYWELSSGEETEEDVPQVQNKESSDGNDENPDVQGEENTSGKWAGSLADKEYADYVAKTFQYLEKFDVTYDKDTEMFYYDGKKIRWLIDELADKENTYKCCHNEKGVIDVYTVRDKEGKLEGVRVADDKEFQEKTDRMESAVLIEEGENNFESGDTTAVVEGKSGASGESSEAVERTYAFTVESAYDDSSYEVSGDIGYRRDDSDEAFDSISIDAVASGNGEEGDGVWEYAEETTEDTGNVFAESDLFRALGLTAKDKNHWMYKEKTVCAIYVEDVSITTWGDIEDGAYLYVTKEQKGDSLIWNIQEVTQNEFERLL